MATDQDTQQLVNRVRDMHDAITELAARWKRAKVELSTLQRGDSSYHHHCGRMAGYEQAIGLLLGTPTRTVRSALDSGEL